MSEVPFLVIGGSGLIGSAVCRYLQRHGEKFLSLDSKNYARHKGSKTVVLINCNGNTYRFRANQEPQFDFQASVVSVYHSLFDFQFDRYVYISTIDVYNELSNPAGNHESVPIQSSKLHAYAFHKWLAERIVEKFAQRFLIVRAATAVGPGLRKGPLYDLLRRQKVYMSLESELCFIETGFLARAIFEILKSKPAAEIYNVTGTGGAKLADLVPLLPKEKKTLVPEQAKKIVYRYHINNEKLRGILNEVPTSVEFAASYLKSSQK